METDEKEDDYGYWELWNLYNAEQAAEWKKEQKNIRKNRMIVGIEEEIHWAKGSFKVIDTDQFADGDGLYFKDGDDFIRVKQINKWECRYGGPTKYVVDLNSKFQVETDD